jgi:hypothetical protein
VNRYTNLLATLAVATINAGLCDYHIRHCPPSEELTRVCDEVGCWCVAGGLGQHSCAGVVSD